MKEAPPTIKEIPAPTKPRIPFRRTLIALAWILSIIVLGYALEDWYGAHAWNDYRRQYEAKVGSLDLRAYVPKEIPDGDNFGATPFAQSWFTHRDDPNFLYETDMFTRAGKLVGGPAKSHHGASRKFVDLVAWQQAINAVQSGVTKGKTFRTDQPDAAARAQAAAAVLEAWSDDQGAIDELRAASARPDCRYFIDYNLENPWGILLPHLFRIKQTCMRLADRASAELALGRGQEALEDIKLSLYLQDSIKNEPFVLSYLVRIACMQINCSIIWEAMMQHSWNEAQLKELQDRLAGCNFIADMQLGLRGERSMAVWTVDLMKKKGPVFLGEIGNGPVPDGTALKLLGWVMPSGWYNLEKLHYCEALDKMIGTTDSAAIRVFPDQVAAHPYYKPTPYEALAHHHVVEAMMMQSIGNLVRKAASVQTATAEAETACALERFYVANHRYPEDLAAIVPKYMAQLPNDVIDGQPLKYRRTDDVNYVLYSVGWNGTDDGGVSGQALFDDKQGDWVW